MTITNLPEELFTHLIFPFLPKGAILSVRLVSAAAKKWMDKTITSLHTEISLDGKEVQIDFKGEFKEQLNAYLLHRMKMSVFLHHPELLATLKSARTAMNSKGKAHPYTIQDYLDYSSEKEMALALIPFDFETKMLQIRRAPPFLMHHGGLSLALRAAAQKNSIELISLVLSHPHATDFEQSYLNLALFNMCFQNRIPLQDPFVDQRIRLALLSHPNATNPKGLQAEDTLEFLEKMLSDMSAQYTLEEYAIILMHVPEQPS